MSSFRIRPTLSQILDLTVNEARERIVSRVEENEQRCQVKNFPGFICLRIEDAMGTTAQIH